VTPLAARRERAQIAFMYALILLLFSLTFGSYGITTHSDGGPGMCPHGGRVTTDGGGGMDPNGHLSAGFNGGGRVRTTATGGDKGLGVDPNG